MILKELYNFAQRGNGNIQPAGTELHEIEYAIVIDCDGIFKRFESLRIDKKRCKSYIVAKRVVRTSAQVSNILWDKAKYVLGYGTDAESCNYLFVKIVKEIASRHREDTSIAAVLKFYDTPREEREAQMATDPLFIEVKDSNSILTFRLENEATLIAEKYHLYADILHKDSAPEGVCLVTGMRGPIARLMGATPLPGNKPSAALVSFKEKKGYDSYGKTQGFNSPISVEAEEKIVRALNELKGKDSRNKAKIGERMFFFWGKDASELDKEVEDSMYLLLEVPDKKDPDVGSKASKVVKLFKSIHSGRITTTLDDHFYILGLAPNTGRIAVVMWQDSSLKEFSGNIVAHFEDMEIVDSRPVAVRRPYFGMPSLISSVTLGGKMSDAIPNLPEAVAGAIFKNTPYPVALYTSALARIRAELGDSPVSVTRAAILKAYINRKNRNSKNIKSLDIMLDKENSNPGYLCGRLAAVLEKIQKDAGNGDSLRTRYMGSASVTPAIVFPAILNVSLHHSEKISEGSRIHYEKLKQEIIDKMPVSGFPAHLSLEDQGRFFVGYYHQRNDLFTAKEK